MLRHLYIKNYALIDVLDIDFEPGFSVITGETGAGKSIILGAIALLLGQRADSKLVKTNTQKCTIEARFDISRYGMREWFESHELDCDDEECIIRRELTATGKSRAFINDTPSPLQLMRELGEMLIDVHSQHQNLLLQKEDFQMSVLDIIAQNTRQRTEYSKAFKAYHDAISSRDKLKERIAATRENEEFMRFQLNELTNAELKEGEQEELEAELDAATHTEEIKSNLYDTYALLSEDNTGTLETLRTITSKLENAARMYPKVQELYERANSTYIELKDIAQEVESATEGIDFNPERLNFINSRLDTIYSLQRKFRKTTISELIEEQRTLQEAINNIDGGDEALAELDELVQTTHKVVQEKADALTGTRLEAMGKVETAIRASLSTLGMPNVEFAIEITKDTIQAKGQDRVAFMFSANKGMELRPVAQVASGGEIARLMLSLKALISGAVKLPTIIFDEIDTGVSGRVAEKMADIMLKMGNANRQVISITHLPQIAAIGSYHYKVEKQESANGTTSIMRRLSTEERINEIAQMLSGSDITEAARSNAITLLKL
ncbi:MAG: DNA repair protein RecN [Prevotellaceae bacterium]|nr:DNA repair protein RecN [Prevotellaceae bacterium]